ncbi:ATP-grasp domain-containing protein [Streptomyces sp. CoH27]|uniref:ATP-grasp domain-containing protein n=1 Tax=Streptomyces sp. CoH27 TaxID=2875763 RepID=UPI001CD4C2DB|nr:ATP-grasp domain-containing protein [Streptomyces sp. CoH27]
MTPPTLVLVESNTTGTGRLFARRARELGALPVLLAEDPDRYAYAREDDIPVVRTDTGSLNAVVAAVRALPGAAPAGLTTSSDYFVPVAAAAAHALRLPGPDPQAVRRVRHKGSQRADLVASGVPVAAHALVSGPEEALSAVDRIGLPVVLKPTDGSGSMGVRLCTTRQEAAEHAARLLARTHNERGMPVARDFLVEQYVAGPEFSVEVFGQRAVAVVAKHLGAAPHFVEIGHDVPAPVPAAEADALAATAVQAVKALGLGFGAAHVELRLGPDGPVLIEVNARLAGGMIPELIRAATGVDLVRAQVTAALGRPVDLEPRSSHHSSLRFLVVDAPSELGVLPDTGGLPHVTGTTLTGRLGVRLVPHHDYRDRVAHVTATAPTAEDATRAAETALARLRTALRPHPDEETTV